MDLRRSLLIVALWAVLAFVAAAIVPPVRELIDVRTALFVVLLPWMAMLGAHPLDTLLRAFLDGWTARRAELPPDRLRESAALLRGLAGMTLAAGLIAFFAAAVASLRAAAIAQNAASIAFVGAAGKMILGPLYALACKAFLYDVLAAGLEDARTDVGAALVEDHGKHADA